MGEVHRLMDFLPIDDPRRGRAISCGAAVETGVEVSSLPSGVTCDPCIETTPGLQLRAQLETALGLWNPPGDERDYIALINAPSAVKEKLLEIRAILSS